jgi:hypothetical protein
VTPRFSAGQGDDIVERGFVFTTKEVGLRNYVASLIALEMHDLPKPLRLLQQVVFGDFLCNLCLRSTAGRLPSRKLPGSQRRSIRTSLFFGGKGL